MALLSSEIGTKEMAPLCRQLATTYTAGIPIIQALEHVSEQTRNGKTKRVLKQMGEDLRNGSTLEQAVGAQSKYLPPFFVHLLASGEKGGRLDIMLRDLSEYFEDRLKMKRMVFGMMTLPIIQLVAAWFLGTFALGIIQGAAEAGGGVDGVMTYIREQYLWLQIRAVGAFLLVGVAGIALARFGLLGWITCAVTTFVWPLRTVTLKMGVARFFRSFGLLLGSGLDIVSCVESAAAVTSNPYIERDLLKAVPHIKRGKTLSEAFAGSKTITPLAREMLHVGELSGNLEGQLKKAAEFHLDEANHAVGIAVKAMSVLIGLAVAAVIGYVIISFYGKMYGGMMDELGI